MDKDPHVVIVGGGFGGLNTARGLAKASVRVTLVDKRNYHLFRPLFVNRLQAPAFLRWLNDRQIEVVVERVNGNADRPRVFIFVRVMPSSRQAAA